MLRVRPCTARLGIVLGRIDPPRGKSEEGKGVWKQMRWSGDEVISEYVKGEGEEHLLAGAEGREQ